MTTNTTICWGWPADWLNSWLAAVGALAICPELKLYWTADPIPLAVLVAPQHEDPVALLAERWPTHDELRKLPLASEGDGVPNLERKVSVESFYARAQLHRSSPTSWTLSSTMTDLIVDNQGFVAHGALDPAGPGTIKWLHHRLMKVWRAVEDPADAVRASVAGTLPRVRDNGLGFDLTRLGNLADSTNVYVDPVVETLAFFGLSLFPVRGDGVDQRIGKSSLQRPRHRSANGRADLTWHAWRPALGLDAVDALLDLTHATGPAQLGGIIIGSWQSFRYEKRGSGDTTRALGARRVWP